MVKIADLRIDQERVENGAWVNIADLPGVRLKVRGFNSKDFAEELARTRQYASRTKHGFTDARFNKLLLDYVLLDWDGLEDGETPVPYSRERAEELLNDPSFKVLRQAVILAADEVGTPPALLR